MLKWNSPQTNTAKATNKTAMRRQTSNGIIHLHGLFKMVRPLRHAVEKYGHLHMIDIGHFQCG
jgi:hypothetical protein